MLVVEPSETDLQELRFIFGGADWELHEAPDVRQALTLLDRHPCCVVISERELPAGTWKDLLQASQARPRPPYLVVSSRCADNRLWADVLNLGGWDVLAKPFQANEARRVVRLAWLRWRRQWETGWEHPDQFAVAV